MQNQENKREYIKVGLTNISYFQNNKFVQEKIFTGFNHKIDYKILSVFDFVPKLLSNQHNFLEWEIIKGDTPTLNNENLMKIANNLKILHSSNLKFPPSNHTSRVKRYRKILIEKNIQIKALNDFYRLINKILSNMNKNIPLHNDLWTRNMIQDEKGKIFFIDWEYAALGDIHFDLAYFIESQELSNEQINIFLNAYGPEFDEKILLMHRILVNSLVVMWAHSQKQLPFKTDIYENKMYILNEQLQKFK
ncbi:MAG: phosphotransferase family protein [Metamycoplasmataceae bacterium]